MGKGIGLDVGTGFLASASFKDDGTISYKSMRNAFHKIPKAAFNPRLFNKTKLAYLEMDDAICLLGSDAIDFAKMKGESAKRPLANGVINPHESSSAALLKEMFNFVIKPQIKKTGEKLAFSIPGPQVNGGKDFDTNYHTMSIQSLCRQLDIEAEPLNEAYAVAISELGTDSISALSFSFGAGLVNACLTFKGIPIFEFSIGKSGDFIDKQAAEAVGEPESIAQHVKENTLNLTVDEFSAPALERALIFSYRFVIQNTLTEVKKAFLANKEIRILEPLPVVISGGTSMPKGFIELFSDEVKRAKLPFEVSEIKHVQNPLLAVAKGCLIWANSMEEEN